MAAVERAGIEGMESVAFDPRVFAAPDPDGGASAMPVRARPPTAPFVPFDRLAPSEVG
jgi:hypothetical protein